MSRVLAAALTLLCVGCVSQSSLDGFELPREARQPGKTFTVLRQPADERALDQSIAAALRARGVDAVAGPREGTDYEVTYIDRWYWDMRMYLIDLRIDVRDARTKVLVATARSYQTSLAAMGETHGSIVERTVKVLIEGSEAERNRRSQSRRSL